MAVALLTESHQTATAAPPTTAVPRLADAVAHYLATLDAQGRAQGTIRVQGFAFKRLVEYFGSDTPLDTITEDQALAFFKWIQGLKTKWGSAFESAYIDGFRVCASAMFTWAARRGFIVASPFAYVKPYRKVQKEIETFTPEEVQRLLATQDKNTYSGYRNVVVMSLLYDCGLRISETCNLRLMDISDRGVHVLMGKGKRERTIPASSGMRAMLEEYIRKHRAGVLPTEPLFARADANGNMRGGPMVPLSVNMWMRRAGRIAGIEKRCSPHSFRHSYASAFLKAGGDQFRLQRFMGHSSLNSTNRYLHFTRSELADQYDDLSPLANMSRNDPPPDPTPPTPTRPKLRLILGGRAA